MLQEAIATAQANDDPYVEGVSAHGEVLDATGDLAFFEFHGLELERCVLAGLSARKARFYDCTFVGCDFSNATLLEAYFSRSRFVDCKLEGAQLAQAQFKSCTLSGCQCRYVNLGEATLEGVTLVDCDLSEAFLSALRLRRRTRLTRCDLMRADLFRTPLKGLDLTTCNIAGIAVGERRDELRGAIISAEQAVDVAALLGLRIADYE